MTELCEETADLIQPGCANSSNKTTNSNHSKGLLDQIPLLGQSSACFEQYLLWFEQQIQQAGEPKQSLNIPARVYGVY